jgi:soluble lytic murein transglycosylase-like protein
MRKKQLAASSLILLSYLCFGSYAMGAPLYEVFGPRGSVTFTSTKPKPGKRYRQIYSPSPKRSRLIARKGRGIRGVKSRFDPIIRNISRERGLDPALVKAVVHAESSFNPRALSKKGAIGLMQLMPATARRLGVANPYRPEDNVRGGTRLLKHLLNRYDGNLSLALAAYNAGERAVDRVGGIPPYKETIGYVRRVKSLFSVYRARFSS